MYGANSMEHNLGQRLIREYYTKEELDRLRREYAALQLPFEDFPAYVGWKYEQEKIDSGDPDER